MAERVLLHVCCAPCMLYPLKVLQQEGKEVFAFWYNPNIHPFTEYQRRHEEVVKTAERLGVRLIERDEYSLEEFLQMVAFREGKRCFLCHQLRLTATAQVAHRGKFTFFTTTLLYSKFQPHLVIKDLGEGLGRRYGSRFLYRDFRDGWKEGIEESKEMELYRQQYCGCIYSEYERYGRQHHE